MNISILLISTLLLLSCNHLLGETDPLPEHRDWLTYIRQDETTVGMVDRANEAHAKLDERIDQILKEILEESDPKAAQLLTDYQKAWKTYARNKGLFASDAYRGGSLQTVLYSNNLIEEQVRHILELQQLHREMNTP